MPGLEKASYIVQIIAAGFVMVSAFAVLVAIWVARRQLKEERKTREAFHLSEKLMEWHSLEMIERTDRAKELKDNGQLTYDYLNDRTRAYVTRVPDFFNSLAALIELEAVREDIVIDYLGPAALYCWDIFSDFVRDLRKNLRRPDLYLGFEELVDRTVFTDKQGMPWIVFNRIKRVREDHRRSNRKSENIHEGLE